ncbi:hypothetical protein CKAH01_10614 [Colletotrichum kahawae]|uniref:AAA+ ATPase domain-containing protein n=1 Tax=Colletotrichum kahawae TaxID=34407 RepID=A0AAD9XYS4_COLKA|nr:hypothetical protein CKAH01_10614 [Colletotrichum kahawae]
MPTDSYSEGTGEEENKVTEDENIGEEAPPTPPAGAMLKLNRVEWGEFIRLSCDPEHEGSVIEIPIGEPPIVNNADNRFPFRPFGFFGHRLGRGRKLEPPKDRKPFVPVAPGKGQLPGRIRIRSTPLFSILNVLLPNALDWSAYGCSLARPFRSLVYCDSELRAWCRTLEKNFDVLDRTSNDSPVGTGDPEVHVQEAGTNVHGADQGDASIIEEDKDGNKTSVPTEKAFREVPDGSSAVEPGYQADQEDEEDDINARGFDEAEEFTKSRTALEELKCLLSFMDSDILPRQQYLRISQCRKVFFSDLWLIFQPGVEVISTDGKQAYRVIGVNTVKQGVTRRWESTKAPFSVTCVYIDFDGKNVGPVRKSFDFKKFDDEKDITSLKVYPIQFHQLRQFDCSDSEREELQTFPADQRFRQKLVRRGAKFLEVAAVKHMYYAGPTLEARDDVESQVVVDFESAFSAGDESRDQREWRPLLEPLVGVSTTEKDAGNDGDDYNGAGCQKPCCNREATHDDAYLDEKHSSNYINSLLPTADNISSQPSIAVIPRPLAELQAGPGKNLPLEDELVIMSYRVFGQTRHYLTLAEGKGLIILLHGAPGVGKTSTAEVVADHFEKPLFQITCGDLGTTASEVEKALEVNFALASRWDCILLLDEADVFLAQRTKDDFTRNGLVAVFLRIMEYYAGVLFLTTNRVGDFDEAFTSRIHISLYYPDLNKEKTEKVFKINLDMIKRLFDEKNRDIEIDKLGIGVFASTYFSEHAEARWNGRQIRNACQTALAMAEFDAHKEARKQSNKHGQPVDIVVRLKVGHFEIVRKAYLEFSKYMHDVYRMGNARLAGLNKMRAIRDPETGGGIDHDARGAEFRRGATGQHFSGPVQLNTPQQQMQQMQPMQLMQLAAFQHPQQQQHFNQFQNPGASQIQPNNLSAGQSFSYAGSGDSGTYVSQPSPTPSHLQVPMTPPQQQQHLQQPSPQMNQQALSQFQGMFEGGGLQPQMR